MGGLDPRSRRASSVTGAILMVAALALAISSAPVAGATPEDSGGFVTPENLRTEYLENPLGIDFQHPRFSWVLKSSERGEKQTAYQILVASTREKLEDDIGDVWDSGKVSSDNQINVVYDGEELESGEKYYWKVRAWDRDGNKSDWSDIAYFQMGLLDPSEWEGDWIGTGVWSVSAPLLRKEFSLSADKEIEEAYAYICGLGFYELYLNGEKVGDHVLDPARTDTKERVLYVTYDVTDHLVNGTNAIGVILGNSWYNLPGSHPTYPPWPQNILRLLFQLEIEFADGAKLSVVSDNSWRFSEGPIVSNSIYHGETYDARLEKEGWTTSPYDDSDWNNVAILDPPGGELCSQLIPPRKIIKTLKPVEITEPKENVYVFDFGEIVTGWPRLYVDGARGTKISLRSAELTKSEIDRISNGRVPVEEPVRTVYLRVESLEYLKERDLDMNSDEYICSGKEGVEIYEPRFTWRGFRYVQVENFPGVPTENNLEARVVYSAVDRVGEFSCSNQLINQIHQNIFRTTAGAHQGVMVGSLTRSERLGYIEDFYYNALQAMYNFDLASFYTNWIGDITYEQEESGKISGVYPWPLDDTRMTEHSYSWYPYIVWKFYQTYEDERLLRQNYDNLKKLMEWGSAHHSPSNPVPWAMPQWCQPEYDEVARFRNMFHRAFYYAALTWVSKIADALGRESDAQHYSSLAENVKDNYNRDFFDEKSITYGGGSQAEYAVPLRLGLVPASYEEEVTGRLVESINERDGHFWVGPVGYKALIECLSEQDRREVIYNFLIKEDFPSYGWQIEMGATTCWERWGGFRTAGYGMNGFTQNMFTAADEFMYRDLAGIIAPTYSGTAVGYKNISIKPFIPEGLEYVSASVRTVRGVVSSAWTKNDNLLTMDVTVPVNCEAEVFIPKIVKRNFIIVESGDIVWGGSYIGGIPGISNGREEDNYVSFAVGSGSYSFKLYPYPLLLPKSVSIKNLRIAREIFKVGEEVVISVDLRNTSEMEGAYPLELSINEEKNRKIVLLPPDESKTVTFTVPAEEPGTYEVEVGGLTDSFTVNGAVAVFELSDLSVSKSEVEPGESFTVSVVVTNTGGESGSYTVELSIDSETKTEDVTLDPGASETVSFDISIEDEGTYTVSAGEMTESVEVSAPEQPEGGEFPIIPVAAGVVVVVAVVAVFAYKRRGR